MGTRRITGGSILNGEYTCKCTKKQTGGKTLIIARYYEQVSGSSNLLLSGLKFHVLSSCGRPNQRVIFSPFRSSVCQKYSYTATTRRMSPNLSVAHKYRASSVQFHLTWISAASLVMTRFDRSVALNKSCASPSCNPSITYSKLLRCIPSGNGKTVFGDRSVPAGLQERGGTNEGLIINNA